MTPVSQEARKQAEFRPFVPLTLLTPALSVGHNETREAWKHLNDAAFRVFGHSLETARQA